MSRVEPNRNVYIGHRYVPLLVGEWDKSIQYEGLSIVTFKGASYTSKKMTPAGIDIENEEFWVLTGNYNAQVEYYRLETERVADDLEQAKIDLNKRIDDNVEYVNSNVEDLTIYVNDEVRKNREYVDGEVTSLTNSVEQSINENKSYVDGEVTSLTNSVEQSINENKSYVDGEVTSLKNSVNQSITNNENFVKEEMKELEESKVNKSSMSLNVKDFGAIGDGQNHKLSEFFEYLSQAKEVYPSAVSMEDEIDQVAIQKALDIVAENGGSVYMPSGKYVLRRGLRVNDDTVLYGDGMYNTLLHPIYRGKNAFPNIINSTAESDERNKNIILHDFGVDGSQLEFTDNGIEASHWARIRLTRADFSSIYNIYCYYGSHVIDLYACHDFHVENIVADYVFNIVHFTNPSNERCERGTVKNLKGTRLTTVADWGAGGHDITITGVHADANGYVRNDQEVFDIGGGTGIKISDVYAVGFYDGINLKGESSIEWDDVILSDVHIKDFKGQAITGGKGDNADNESGTLKIFNSTFISNSRDENSSAIYLTDFIDLTLQDVEVHVNKGTGVDIEVFKEVNIDGLTVRSEDDSLTIKGLEQAGYWGNGFTVRNVNLTSTLGTGFKTLFCVKEAILENFSIKDSFRGLDVSGVKYFTGINGNIENTTHRGVHITIQDYDVVKTNDKNYTYCNLTNINVRNWGVDSQNVGVIYFINRFNDNDIVGDLKGLVLKNINLGIEGEQNNQIGLLIGSTFESNKLSSSNIEITTRNVWRELVGDLGLGTENDYKLISG